MKRTMVFVIAAALVGFATSANAATISIDTDKTTYLTGESILLTVTADSEGETGFGVLVGVVYDSSLASNGPDAVQGTYDNGNATPVGTTNSPGTYTTHAAILGLFTPTDPGSPASTGSLIADAEGVLSLGSGMNTAGETFAFLSAVPTAGLATVTIVPEPTTAALLGLGLFGLALGGRRR